MLGGGPLVSSIEILDAENRYVARVVTTLFEPLSQTDMANAHLIAAAPDLLAVLEKILPNFAVLRITPGMAGPTLDCLEAEARAAVAKAWGE